MQSSQKDLLSDREQRLLREIYDSQLSEERCLSERGFVELSLIVERIARLKTETEYPFCKWLAQKNVVVDYYLQLEDLSQEEKEQITDKITIPKGAVVLADNNYDGCLIAFPNNDPLKVIAPCRGDGLWIESLERYKNKVKAQTPLKSRGKRP